MRRGLEDRPAHIYLCGFTKHIVKVGMTTRPDDRVKAIAKVGARRGFLIEHKEILWSGRRAMAFAIERELIFALAEKYRNTALDVEWFQGADFVEVKNECLRIIAGPREYKPNAYYRFKAPT